MAKQKSDAVRYPWTKWFQRRKLRLVRGRDFNCMPHSMGVQIRNAAIQRGRRVSIAIREEDLLVTIQPE